MRNSWLYRFTNPFELVFHFCIVSRVCQLEDDAKAKHMSQIQKDL